MKQPLAENIEEVKVSIRNKVEVVFEKVSFCATGCLINCQLFFRTAMMPSGIKILRRGFRIMIKA